MSRLLCALAIACAAAPAVAHAAAPRIDVLVVGRSGDVAALKTVRPKAPTVRVGSRRCRVPARTPLGALAATKLRVRGRDEGICGKRARDAGTIYVTRVGKDRAFGRQGWVYKVGRRAGTTPAGDLSGPFGTGRLLRTGDRLTWFWCVLGEVDTCQRTLAAAPSARSLTAGAPLDVTVRGYDDNGRGRLIAGATVTVGTLTATTGDDGVARFATVPAGTHDVVATKAGLVRSFPEEVRAR